MPTAPERRRYERFKPEDTYVLACYSAELGDLVPDPYNLATKLIDIGAKGVCMVTVGRLREGLPVHVDLTLHDSRTRIRSRATVRWSSTLESRGRTAHVAGLEFDKVLEGARDRVEFLGVWMRGPARGATPEPVRRHKRFSPDHAKLSCFPRGLLSALGFRSEVGRGLKDLSLGGAQIVSRKRLRPGRRVDLVLEFRHPRSIIRAQGVVRWCRRDTLTLESRWNVGVTFTRLSPDDDDHLRGLEKIFLG